MDERDNEPKRLEAFAEVPSEQRFQWRLMPMEGRLMDAASVGKSVASVCEILCAMDKSGRDLFPALMGVRIAEDGAFEADIALLPINPPSKDTP